MVWTLTVLAVAVALEACASAPVRRPGIEAVPTNVEIDTTGGDIAKLDSLLRSGAPIPTLLEVPMVPIPISRQMNGAKVDAVFTVDENGKITRLSLKQPIDRKYGQALVRQYLTAKFRPAQRADGTRVPGVYMLSYDFGSSLSRPYRFPPAGR